MVAAVDWQAGKILQKTDSGKRGFHSLHALSPYMSRCRKPAARMRSHGPHVIHNSSLLHVMLTCLQGEPTRADTQQTHSNSALACAGHTSGCTYQPYLAGLVVHSHVVLSCLCG